VKERGALPFPIAEQRKNARCTSSPTASRDWSVSAVICFVARFTAFTQRSMDVFFALSCAKKASVISPSSGSAPAGAAARGLPASFPAPPPPPPPPPPPLPLPLPMPLPPRFEDILHGRQFIFAGS